MSWEWMNTTVQNNMDIPVFYDYITPKVSRGLGKNSSREVSGTIFYFNRPSNL